MRVRPQRSAPPDQSPQRRSRADVILQIENIDDGAIEATRPDLEPHRGHGLVRPRHECGCPLRGCCRSGRIEHRVVARFRPSRPSSSILEGEARSACDDHEFPRQTRQAMMSSVTPSAKYSLLRVVAHVPKRQNHDGWLIHDHHQSRRASRYLDLADNHRFRPVSGPCAVQRRALRLPGPASLSSR